MTTAPARARTISSPLAPPWQHPCPISKAPQAAVEKAVKLRADMETSLAQKDDATISPGDFERAGLAAYEKQFGHSISARHWHRLFRRTLERDRGYQNWIRLEIYLDENVRPVSAATGPAPAHRQFTGPHTEALGDIIKTLENPSDATAGDRKFLFAAAFRHLEDFAGNNPHKAKKFKRSLIAFLSQAVPALAKNPESFERVFYLKLAAWKESGSISDALEDRRCLASGNFRKTDFAADMEKIRDSAILHGGNETLAYRKLRQDGQLSDEFVNNHKFDPRQNKSYLPRSVDDAITRR
jgi:hypothetical protein